MTALKALELACFFAQFKSKLLAKGKVKAAMFADKKIKQYCFQYVTLLSQGDSQTIKEMEDIQA
ncbi:hypothetical protein OIO07_07855 [Bacillus paralicheniformis]|jgi:hypothetical protein|uniref:Uncharacterized protein n=2 Tax=Bacillus subtilis group TaxID=653685 RepID=A0A8B5YC22_BACLI|nr:MULTISPECIES: hypothetical protein [Bacillus]KUL16129.1 hypothetical protein LI6934_17295 [Bacillus licheniformis LMG 6934]ATI77084.1 hypothetical protein CPQ91_14980 [Bacillus licheniformis]AUZ31619.1 hypothetical protein C1T27_15105 [Bacillus licheniformis]AYQ17380.1 hypothetical protein D5285_15515 [Bacillus paralicheniformis]EFV71346.1 hypothetical protein HMPREF1012_02455 [Bacillus sp. BT1B_CT2]